MHADTGIKLVTILTELTKKRFHAKTDVQISKLRKQCLTLEESFTDISGFWNRLEEKVVRSKFQSTKKGKEPIFYQRVVTQCVSKKSPLIADIQTLKKRTLSSVGWEVTNTIKNEALVHIIFQNLMKMSPILREAVYSVLETNKYKFSKLT